MTLVWYAMQIRISTHTLTWSVTLQSDTFHNDLVISTHTLTWSVTEICNRKNQGIYHFNSHAHVERDGIEKPLGVWDFISTHTLTWSVTRLLFQHLHRTSNFNSHAHVERDYICCGYALYLLHFNSHAHVERDSVISMKVVSPFHFNSHAHVERDRFKGLKTSRGSISTHTLTWSVTLDVVYIRCLLNVMRTYFFI